MLDKSGMQARGEWDFGGGTSNEVGTSKGAVNAGNLPVGIADALQGSFNKEASESTGRYDDALEMARPYAFGEAFAGPNYDKFSSMVQNDPRLSGANQAYDQSLGRMQGSADQFSGAAQRYNKQSQNFLNGMTRQGGALHKAAFGNGPSYADKYGAAQRQQAQGDIARQAAMGSRGGMNAASQRAAIMQSSNVGANMASQVAAARVQERQQAMQQYLSARSAQQQAKQSGLSALGQAAGIQGTASDARGGAVDRAGNQFAGSLNAAGQDYATKMGGWQNLGIVDGGG